MPIPNPIGDPAARPQPHAGPRVELELPLPPGGAAPFDLAAAVCSHGLFMMAPNRWDPAARALVRPLRLASDRSASLLARVSAHPARPGTALLVAVEGADALSSLDRDYILEQVRRMLRLSEEDGAAVAEFQAMHAAAREEGFGRIFRSPTLFEDMVKCILLCNCQWTRTLSMATALCEIQLELKCSSSVEDFQSRTPPIRERKRKRSKRQSVRIKLETRFAEDKLEGPTIASGTSNDLTHPETNEYLSSLASVASETGSACDSLPSLDNSELSLNNAPGLEDCIGDFPTPEELANLDEGFLAKRCNLGYRAKRIVMLARGVVEGKVCLQKLEEMCRISVPAAEEVSTIESACERLNKELSAISGFGPFTRANVLMCMGFNHTIPADTETIRHLKQVHKRASTISSVHQELDKIYGKYAPFQFLAYWFELWGFYNKQFGKICEMEPSNYRLFTASHLKKAKN
ncbi:hypothetical protein SETIT_2G416800v2 [Setaria italica]|uniref:Uncharacterized protein n=1 Tax=Setaria italica TaxID=4555 RepID=K3ZT48_SETIT|nr:uncharacterized protein LOC101766322 [Setaria italica]RCV14328.1 hypothetical protein SETIT_2G416800v2 [Setaria italica]RCV14329.1 hypothetical protein SETIT_2G416800v2 [Setaria italica]